MLYQTVVFLLGTRGVGFVVGVSYRGYDTFYDILVKKRIVQVIAQDVVVWPALNTDDCFRPRHRLIVDVIPLFQRVTNGVVSGRIMSLDFDNNTPVYTIVDSDGVEHRIQNNVTRAMSSMEPVHTIYY